jgi:pimeloyl-ACP methyl ester carboxylesterase
MKLKANGLRIEFEDTAIVDGELDAQAAKRPVVLLIMGLGMQLVAWPPQMVQELVDAGYRVIRFDNRDIGLSTHLDALGKPNILWAGLKFKLGIMPTPPYTLTDMAHDALGVLDELEIEKAHIVGASMGGMIAQRVAIAAPQRCLSLTSIMSTSGARGLPKPKPEILRVILRKPKSKNTQVIVDHFVHVFRLIGSPTYPIPEDEARARIAIGVKRSYHPVGSLRQMLAIATDITRAAQLPRITSPTLVLHGLADPLVPFACAQDTARRIAGAKLVAIPGMGHDLPAEPVAKMLQHMISHFKNAEKPAKSKLKVA